MVEIERDVKQLVEQDCIDAIVHSLMASRKHTIPSLMHIETEIIRLHITTLVRRGVMYGLSYVTMATAFAPDANGETEDGENI